MDRTSLSQVCPILCSRLEIAFPNISLASPCCSECICRVQLAEKLIFTIDPHRLIGNDIYVHLLSERWAASLVLRSFAGILLPVSVYLFIVRLFVVSVFSRWSAFVTDLFWKIKLTFDLWMRDDRNRHQMAAMAAKNAAGKRFEYAWAGHKMKRFFPLRSKKYNMNRYRLRSVGEGSSGVVVEHFFISFNSWTTKYE